MALGVNGCGLGPCGAEEWAWRVVDPIVKVWSMERDFINTYAAGTWGPRGTYRLFEREDQFWRHSLDIKGANLEAY